MNKNGYTVKWLDSWMVNSHLAIFGLGFWLFTVYDAVERSTLKPHIIFKDTYDK